MKKRSSSSSGGVTRNKDDSYPTPYPAWHCYIPSPPAAAADKALAAAEKKAGQLKNHAAVKVRYCVPHTCCDALHQTPVHTGVLAGKWCQTVMPCVTAWNVTTSV